MAKTNKKGLAAGNMPAAATPEEVQEPEADTNAEADRKRVLGDYEKALAKVNALKSMTDTEAWRQYYRGILQRIDLHGRDVLDAEKPRDVIHHQEGVKILRQLIDEVRGPVEALNAYVREMPLFALEFHTAAEWNGPLGIVVMKSMK